MMLLRACLISQRRRRGGVQLGVGRSETPGLRYEESPKPLARGGGKAGALKIPLIERHAMRLQHHFEFFQKRNRSMMFFLPLDITSYLRNLRFTHAEGAISFLPRETSRLRESPGNPSRGISLYLADKFGDSLVLPQFRQDVNMVCGSINYQRDAAFAANRAAEIFVNPGSNRRRYPRLASLCRKDEMIQKIAMGGTHTRGPFRRPFSGAWLSSHSIPGVPLCSTPRFIPPHPTGLLNSGESRRASTPSCSSATPHSRLYSAASPALFSLVRSVAERRRRGGLKPRAKRSKARGNYRIDIFKPLTRGDGEAAGFRRSFR
jgi:hypothetical protein